MPPPGFVRLALLVVFKAFLYIVNCTRVDGHWGLKFHFFPHWEGSQRAIPSFVYPESCGPKIFGIKCAGYVPRTFFSTNQRRMGSFLIEIMRAATFTPETIRQVPFDPVKSIPIKFFCGLCPKFLRRGRLGHRRPSPTLRLLI